MLLRLSKFWYMLGGGYVSNFLLKTVQPWDFYSHFIVMKPLPTRSLSQWTVLRLPLYSHCGPPFWLFRRSVSYSRIIPSWPSDLIWRTTAFLATFLTLCHAKYSNCYWVELTALALTVLAALPDGVLFLSVKNEMQTVGEGIITSVGPGSSTLLSTLPPTRPGSNHFSFLTLWSGTHLVFPFFSFLYLTAFSLIVVAIICLCGGAILRYSFAKKNAAPAGGKAEEGKAGGKNDKPKIALFSGPYLQPPAGASTATQSQTATQSTANPIPTANQSTANQALVPSVIRQFL